MSAIHTDPTGYRLSIVDDDPLRARREVRELLASLAKADPQVALDVPRQRTGSETDKGVPVADLVGLVFSGGSLAVAGIQLWLARVPQRTVVVSRPDGATLRITGSEARSDDERIARFLSGAPEGSDEEESAAE
ncbi:effector-associated constant component EACC1 [Streptomyces iconiensis]|uniref:Uncharacterized protein n=1 Tax=Streptomyces iconiensis TaxID=1384038 RepID=A0ABT6ZP09_9ACTN|nr:hypothetical protein [Streptomyces iconiensis]MDJ1130788.1 hypothetical protein [Streptomyces iconiensis]